MMLDVAAERMVLERLEDELGPMAFGWSRNADGVPMPFQVLRFNSGPADHAVTFATLGISAQPLQSIATGREIWQEFLLTCSGTQVDWNIPAVLQQFGAEVTRQRRSVLRGEVVGPRGQLFSKGSMTSLYAAIPVYFPEELHAVTVRIDREVVLVWLVPVHTSEADFVRHEGWESFEQRLAETQPDLCDLTRPAIV